MDYEQIEPLSITDVGDVQDVKKVYNREDNGKSNILTRNMDRIR